MRLWHYELLEFLPNPQLVSQKRECDMILKLHLFEGRKVNSIVINYVYEYDFYDIFNYYFKLKLEFEKRHYKFNSIYLTEMINRYGYSFDPNYHPFIRHHTDTYLKICYYNLYEKYLRGQKGFSDDNFLKLQQYVDFEIGI